MGARKTAGLSGDSAYEGAGLAAPLLYYYYYSNVLLYSVHMFFVAFHIIFPRECLIANITFKSFFIVNFVMSFQILFVQKCFVTMRTCKM